MKEFIKKMLTSGTGVSSKRTFGALGWLVCLGITVWCTYSEKQAPNITVDIMWASSLLLGLETITKVWNRDKNSEDNVGNIED